MSIVLTLFEICLFWAFYCPYMAKNISIGLSSLTILIMSVNIIIIIILAIMTMALDPTEPLVYKSGKDDGKKYEYQ